MEDIVVEVIVGVARSRRFSYLIRGMGGGEDVASRDSVVSSLTLSAEAGFQPQ